MSPITRLFLDERRAVSIRFLCLLVVMLTLGWGCAQRSVGDIDAIEAAEVQRVRWLSEILH